MIFAIEADRQLTVVGGSVVAGSAAGEACTVELPSLGLSASLIRIDTNGLPYERCDAYALLPDRQRSRAVALNAMLFVVSMYRYMCTVYANSVK